MASSKTEQDRLLQQRDTNTEDLFSPVICFNTQPWFSTLHWGPADGFNTGKVGLQHFTLLPQRPATDTHIKPAGAAGLNIDWRETQWWDWVYVQEFQRKGPTSEKQQSRVTRCFTTQWFTGTSKHKSEQQYKKKCQGRVAPCENRAMSPSRG